jgi:membrane AbrB-like protein
MDSGTKGRWTAGLVLRLVSGAAIGAAGALVFNLLSLPLPWFLGSLTFSLIAAVLRVPFATPGRLSIPARIVLGIAVGTAFTPAIVAQAPGMLVSLLLLFPWMLAILGLGPIFFERLAGFDKPTAFFASVPGGLNDMVAMAEDLGANVRAVTIIQATRIMLIVFAVPFWLKWHDGFDVVGRALTNRVWLSSIGVRDIVLLLVVGLAGYLVADRLRVAAAAIVGPMVLSAVVHATGLTTAQLPFEVLTVAQIVLGVVLGAQFRGLTFDEFRATMTWGLAFSILLVAISALVAMALARFTAFSPSAILLAFAPGGQGELNLLAYVLSLDVAYVALHHLVRLAIVIFVAQWVFKRFKRNA